MRFIVFLMLFCVTFTIHAEDPQVVFVQEAEELIVYLPVDDGAIVIENGGEFSRQSATELLLDRENDWNDYVLHIPLGGDIWLEDDASIIEIPGGECSVEVPHTGWHLRAKRGEGVKAYGENPWTLEVFHAESGTTEEVHVQANQEWSSLLGKDLYDVDHNPYISAKHKEIVKQYLLPKDHPAFIALDPVFHSSRATYNVAAFEGAGFIQLTQKKYLLAGYHKTLPKYLVKGVTDLSKRKTSSSLLRRVVTAERMHEVIEKYNLKHVVVPHKWVYPLPVLPDPPKSARYRKGFVLVETKLDFLTREETKKLWGQESTWTQKMVEDLFILLSRVPLFDCGFINVRFTPDKTQLALFDLEYPSKSMHFANKRLAKALPKKWRDYWGQLYVAWKAENGKKSAPLKAA